MQKMTIPQLCQQISDLYFKPDFNREEEAIIFGSVFKIRRILDDEEVSLEVLSPLLLLATEVAKSKKKYKQILEKELLNTIYYTPYYIWSEGDSRKAGEVRYARGKDNPEGARAEALINFALSNYKIAVNRDAFAGQRRGFSIQILKSLTHFFDVPELLELCQQSIKSRSKKEYIETLSCLKEYYGRNKTLIIPEEMIEVIEKRIKKTKHRTELVSSLDFLISIGASDELEAMDTLAEWKEKYMY